MAAKLFNKTWFPAHTDKVWYAMPSPTGDGPQWVTDRYVAVRADRVRGGVPEGAQQVRNFFSVGRVVFDIVGAPTVQFDVKGRDARYRPSTFYLVPVEDSFATAYCAARHCYFYNDAPHVVVEAGPWDRLVGLGFTPTVRGSRITGGPSVVWTDTEGELVAATVALSLIGFDVARALADNATDVAAAA